jgi:hypothetical protein
MNSPDTQNSLVESKISLSEKIEQMVLDGKASLIAERLLSLAAENVNLSCYVSTLEYENKSLKKESKRRKKYESLETTRQ